MPIPPINRKPVIKNRVVPPMLDGADGTESGASGGTATLNVAYLEEFFDSDDFTYSAATGISTVTLSNQVTTLDAFQNAIVLYRNGLKDTTLVDVVPAQLTEFRVVLDTLQIGGDVTGRGDSYTIAYYYST